MTISTCRRDRAAKVWNGKRGGSVELVILNMEKIESGPVADYELLRLFLVGWDVPAFCARLPVPSGVRQ
jgi:hypothetical protein